MSVRGLLDLRSQPVRNRVINGATRGVSGITAYGSSTVTQNVATTGPGGTVTAVRSSWVAGTQTNPGVMFATSAPSLVLPNETVTVSCWIYVESSAPIVLAIALPNVKAASNVTVPVGAWTRMSATFKNTTAVIASSGVRHASQSSTGTAGSFLATNFMITSGPTLHDFADGNTTGWVALSDGTSVGYPGLA